MKPFIPECFRPPNTFIKRITYYNMVDRVGNSYDKTVGFYRAKKNKKTGYRPIRHMTLRIKWSDK